MDSPTQPNSPAPSPSSKPFRFWFGLPLFIRMMVGLIVGLIIGVTLRAHWHGPAAPPTAKPLLGFTFGCDQGAKLVIRLLGAVAMPLILLAVVRALISTEIKGAAAGRLVYLLLLNTVVAILVGLTVANVLKPGTHAHPPEAQTVAAHKIDPLGDFLASIPDSLLRPLVENNAIGVIILALSFGTAARRLPPTSRDAVLHAVSIAFELVVVVLHWVLELVPFAVAMRVAYQLISGGLEPFKALAWFVLSVLMALGLQSGYYLVRVRIRSAVSPWKLLHGTTDALVMAFSTGSSVATMPVTYECLTARIGLGPDSASLGVLVGGNFNHDGTALYEAMSALFVAQALGMHLLLRQQLIVVITSMIAAVGAAGIPEAGLVTMTMVFSAVGLPTALVAMLLPVDWFLDRCRTAINVMGDTSVACLLEGSREGH